MAYRDRGRSARGRPPGSRSYVGAGPARIRRSRVPGILDDAKKIRNRAFHAATQLFRRIGFRRITVVLLLEDLHWADGESLDLFACPCEVGRDVPLLMLACCRMPEIGHQRVL